MTDLSRPAYTLSVGELLDLLAARLPQQTAPSSEADEVLNTTRAAKLLGIDQVTLRTEAAAGRLPGMLVGNGWKFSRNALLATLRCPHPTDTAPLRVQQSKAG